MVEENVLYDFDLLKFIEFFLWPNIWLIVENVACTLEENVYLLMLGGMFCMC